MKRAEINDQRRTIEALGYRSSFAMVVVLMRLGEVLVVGVVRYAQMDRLCLLGRYGRDRRAKLT